MFIFSLFLGKLGFRCILLYERETFNERFKLLINEKSKNCKKT